MILMWLGSFFLMLYALYESQNHLAALFSSVQMKILNKGLDGSLPQVFIRALGLVLGEASPQRSLYSGMALYNLRIASLRPGVLVMALSTLGAWWVLCLGLLFLGFNGFFLLGFCILGIFSFRVTPRLTHLSQFVLWLGLFLVGAEMTLRNSSVIQNILGQSDAAFFLADGRFPAVLTLFVFAILASFIIKLEFWSLALGLSLLAPSTLSLNGALALFAGERVGRMILFWWRSRTLNQDCRRIGTQLAAVSVIGVLLGFWLAGEARNLFYFNFSAEMSAIQERSAYLVTMSALILFCQFTAQMVWGHFGSRVKVDELQEAKFFSVEWKEFGLLSPAVLAWAKDKVHKRLSEIRYHLQGLNSLKEGQVPEHIQARLKEEERQLSQLGF